MPMQAKIATSSMSLGAFILLTATAAYADPVPQIDWTTQTDNFASVSVDPQNNVDLSVFKTSWAKADANLGNLNGSLDITFDWTTTAQGWYEVPAVSLATNGGTILQIPGCDGHTNVLANSACGTFIGLPLGTTTPGIGGLAVSPYATTTGSFSEDVAVKGQTDVTFA